MTVSDVAGDNLDLVQSRNILQPAPEIERIILGQRRYVRSGAQQMFDQVGADESISPRYKNAFALKFHLAELSPRFHFRSPTGPSGGAWIIFVLQLLPLCSFNVREASRFASSKTSELGRFAYGVFPFGLFIKPTVYGGCC
jgi:hypothetical protein